MADIDDPGAPGFTPPAPCTDVRSAREDSTTMTKTHLANCAIAQLKDNGGRTDLAVDISTEPRVA